MRFIIIAKYMKKGRGLSLFNSLDAACIGKKNSEITIALLCVAIRRLNYKSLQVLAKSLSSISKEDFDKMKGESDETNCKG